MSLIYRLTYFSPQWQGVLEKAIAVILSGTGSDGTRGCLAVNSAGGFVLVQDPSDAKFDGMPASAISTGVVDVIAAAKDLDSKLYEYLQKPDIKLLILMKVKRIKKLYLKMRLLMVFFVCYYNIPV